MISLKRNVHGFTLVEMAIVFLIMAILLGGGLVGLARQQEQQKITDTQTALAEAKEALIGYAASTANARLPCPDRTAGPGANDGVADPVTGGPCAVVEGNLPWVTLGIQGLDGWGHRFRYRVDPNFSVSTGITRTATAALTVNNNESAAIPLATGVPAVILSHGANGWGATPANPPVGWVAVLPPLTNIDERENTNGNTIFTGGQPHDNTALNGEFDDIVTWLPANVLKSRILQAKGSLP